MTTTSTVASFDACDRFAIHRDAELGFSEAALLADDPGCHPCCPQAVGRYIASTSSQSRPSRIIARVNWIHLARASSGNRQNPARIDDQHGLDGPLGRAQG